MALRSLSSSSLAMCKPIALAETGEAVHGEGATHSPDAFAGVCTPRPQGGVSCFWLDATRPGSNAATFPQGMHRTHTARGMSHRVGCNVNYIVLQAAT